MHRYIAFLWAPGDVRAAERAGDGVRRLGASADGWSCVYRCAGLAVLYLPAEGTPALSCAIGDGAGVVLGTLFSRQSEPFEPPAADFLHGIEGRSVIGTGGRRLTELVWGAYVAFFHDRAAGRIHVLRDPSGRVPCYHWSRDGMEIVFAQTGDAAAALAAAPEVDWSGVAAFLGRRLIPGHRTALTGIRRIGPGECLTVAGRQREFVPCWTPESFCRSPGVPDFDHAALQLRRTAQACIAAWTSRSRSIVLELSGGFDSAAVLACLRRAPDPPRVTAFNYYAGGHEGDERGFARLAARHAAVDLVEHDLMPGTARLAEALEQAPLTPEPTPHITGFVQTALRDELAQRHGADQFWTGQGGDQLFYRLKSAVVAADHIREHGFDRQFFRVLRESVQLTGLPFGTVLYRALRDGLPGRGGGRPVAMLPSILSGEAAVLAERPAAEPVGPGLPPAKRLQVFALTLFLHHLDLPGMCGRAGILHPLISQPLMELCLGLPVPLLTNGGRFRALARHAFAGQIPAPILERESKGGTAHYFYRLIADNRRFIADYLTDGVLMREGLLDRQKTQALLSAGRAVRASDLLPLIDCVAAEAWARRATGMI